MTNLTFLTKDPPVEKLRQSGRVGSRIFFEAVMAPINEMNQSNQHSLFMTEATQWYTVPPWQGYVNSKSIDWN